MKDEPHAHPKDGRPFDADSMERPTVPRDPGPPCGVWWTKEDFGSDESASLRLAQYQLDSLADLGSELRQIGSATPNMDDPAERERQRAAIWLASLEATLSFMGKSGFPVSSLEALSDLREALVTVVEQGKTPAALRGSRSGRPGVSIEQRMRRLAALALVEWFREHKEGAEKPEVTVAKKLQAAGAKGWLFGAMGDDEKVTAKTLEKWAEYGRRERAKMGDELTLLQHAKAHAKDPAEQLLSWATRGRSRLPELRRVEMRFANVS